MSYKTNNLQFQFIRNSISSVRLETPLHDKPFIKKAKVDSELLNLKLKGGVKEIEEHVN